MIIKDITAASGKKTSAGVYPFVISSDSPDRVGDTIAQDGLKHSSRLQAMLNHSHDVLMRVGDWINFRKSRGAVTKTIADLELLPPGISKQADFIRDLLDHGYSIGASIGFRSISAMPNSKGMHYKEIDLLECSLVSVPCNADAVRLAKRYGVDVQAINKMNNGYQPSQPSRYQVHAALARARSLGCSPTKASRSLAKANRILACPEADLQSKNYDALFRAKQLLRR